jgi:hypothetical protein
MEKPFWVLGFSGAVTIELSRPTATIANEV